MHQRFETTLIVDGEGGARLEGPLTVAPGRHRVTVLVDDESPHTAETWATFIEQTFGSLAGSDLVRPPQGVYERRDALS